MTTETVTDPDTYLRSLHPDIRVHTAAVIINRLQSEIDRLKKDSERLDWLEKSEKDLIFIEAVEGEKEWSVEAKWLPSVRAAIDEAMNEEQEEK